ncbi:hypothetical protein [Marinomonas transparens]|uniref:Uncharacterized protein n=1 Tax=Marinomonas transparens TaxID=2795388 RepID=A0A934JRB6_9GAMM|nr:hypothetical protein [Marinomonas transparens]MBJ7539263.1 hypothetical protein [Marinomonas transparens]
MAALEEQRKQLLGWMMQYPPKPLEERLACSYHAMNPSHEVVQARTTTATETTFNQYEITLFNEGMPNV